jgi:hypothetical protein
MPLPLRLRCVSSPMRGPGGPSLAPPGAGPRVEQGRQHARRALPLACRSLRRKPPSGAGGTAGVADSGGQFSRAATFGLSAEPCDRVPERRAHGNWFVWYDRLDVRGPGARPSTSEPETGVPCSGCCRRLPHRRKAIGRASWPRLARPAPPQRRRGTHPPRTTGPRPASFNRPHWPMNTARRSHTALRRPPRAGPSPNRCPYAPPAQPGPSGRGP